MLASIIDRLTSLVSKYLVIGFFVPVLIFAFIAGAILYHNFSWFREWARPEVSGTAKAFDAAVVLIGFSVVAYLFSVVGTFLREILEGKHLLEYWPALMQRLQIRQQEKLTEIQTAYETAKREHETIAHRRSSWRQALSNAASDGIRDHKNVSIFDPESEAALAVDNLQTMRSLTKGLSSADVDKAVNLLVALLKENDESSADSSGHPSLREKRFNILELIDYAEDYWSSVELRQFNERQSRFGISFVAPTAMGNVSQTMQAYAVTRYQLNLEKFWGDLQAILQSSNRDFFSQLQDAKTQLDFLVTCYWLSALITLGCGPILLVKGQSAVLFLAVVLGGPLGAYFFYLLAVKSYQSFAELVRIGVDLYRFQLLDSLHVARPRTARDERVIWSVLQRLSYLGAEGTELSFKQDTMTGAQ
jgi:hypothetical protein